VTKRAALVFLLSFAAAVPCAQAQQTPPPQHGNAATMTEMQAADRGTALDAQARSHYRVGLTLYQEGRFRDSAAEFQQAYDLSHRSQLLYNVYLAYRDAGDVEHSTTALRQYLAESPDDHTDQRQALVARLASMDETVRQQQAQQAALAEQQRTLETQRQAVAAHEEELRRAEAARQAHEAELRAQAARTHTSYGLSVPGIVVGGVGLAAVVTGIIVGSIGLSTASDLDKMCPSHLCPASAAGTRDSARLLTGLGDALWISGAGIAAVGLLLFLLNVGSPSETVTASGTPVTASCGLGGCTAGIRF